LTFLADADTVKATLTYAQLDHKGGGPNFAYELCLRKVTAQQRATRWT
jgi:hypothetical protein